MIQTSFFPQLEKVERTRRDILKEMTGKERFCDLYPVRYIHPKTGVVCSRSHYLEGGRKKTGRQQFFINNEWVYKEKLPEERESRRLRESTLSFFMRKIKEAMRNTNGCWKEENREVLGVNEFEDKWNCADKLRVHFDEQVKKYGYMCPVTHIAFTTIRRQERKRTHEKIITNVSADRLFDHINYTKQNVLFTSLGWNLARSNFSLEDIEKLFPGEYIERYKKIVLERFPNSKDYE